MESGEAGSPAWGFLQVGHLKKTHLSQVTSVTQKPSYVRRREGGLRGAGPVGGEQDPRQVRPRRGEDAAAETICRGRRGSDHTGSSRPGS